LRAEAGELVGSGLAGCLVEDRSAACRELLEQVRFPDSPPPVEQDELASLRVISPLERPQLRSAPDKLFGMHTVF
jgi:hypothetical protein